MYVEAVVTCVNYSDFLVYTLPQIKEIFNYTVVVTTPDDRKTQQVCSFHNVECITTWDFYEDGAKFNKAKGINQGLLYLSKRDWVVHIDADVYLPPLTKQIIRNINLDKSKLYGIDRLMCPNYDEWMRYVENPKPIHDGWIFVHLDKFPIASRIADYNGYGYAPIGYFQLWNPKESGVSVYPEHHDGADRTDMLFAKQWDRKYRELIPEIVGIHLDSENATVKNMGKNWNGRKTKPFGYSPVVKKKFRIDLEMIMWIITGTTILGALVYTILGSFGLLSF